MDLREIKEANTVTATFELPGLTKEDVVMHLHDGRLTLSGEIKASSEYDGSEYHLRERTFGTFSRTVQLPPTVKVSWVFYLVNI